jgi:protein-S-isoprenylcysteine O-methyltransferase Ste14
MIYILVGATAFLILFWVDLAAIKRIPIVKPFLWAAGTFLFGFALWGVSLSPPRLIPPRPLQILGGCLATAFLLLLVYSLFIEIPFRNAYTQRGTDQRLVTGGTYALVRHPGVLWQIGLMTGLLMLTGSLILLIALPLWTALNILYVVIQDKHFFPRMFGQEYKNYQDTVPLLLPTRASFRTCLRTIHYKPDTPRRQA